MKYKMNNFNYINTLERKNNDDLVIIKSNIKSKAEDGDSIPSCLGDRQVRYAL